MLAISEPNGAQPSLRSLQRPRLPMSSGKIQPSWDDYQEMHDAFERQRAALRARMIRERQAVDGLLGEVDGWQKAKAIRAYVSAVKTSAKRNGTIGDLDKWLAWASDQADRVDPFRVSPPSVLDTPRDQYRDLTPDEAFAEDGSIEHA